jgi:ribulose-5-phosphate 4-epimerase/fuculose-1-phosphate aldolase
MMRNTNTRRLYPMAAVDELRKNVAISCRILGTQLGSGGHVSARIAGTDEMWLRCRGGRTEGGLSGTDLHHIRRVDFDGEGPGLGAKHASPHETPLHGEIYRARPDVNAVVHVHPRYALLCGVTEVEFTPIFGGYNPGLLRIALEGVPIYPRAATVVDKEMAAEMIEIMGSRDVVLLRGHGIAATGSTVEAATSAALRFESFCEIYWQIALSGRRPVEISADDKARYDPRRPQQPWAPSRDWQTLLASEGEEIGGGWRGYVRRLEATAGLPDETLDDG